MPLNNEQANLIRTLYINGYRKEFFYKAFKEVYPDVSETLIDNQYNFYDKLLKYQRDEFLKVYEVRKKEYKENTGSDLDKDREWGFMYRLTGKIVYIDLVEGTPI